MTLKNWKTVETDVLVVGAGAAGLMAAISAGNRTVSVAVKGVGATCMAPGGIAAVGQWCKEGDSRDLHFKDFVEGGAYLNEQKLVHIVVDEVVQKTIELEKYGAFWERTDDGKRYLLRNGGGHTYWRSVYCEDHTGREALRALESEAKRRNIHVYNNVMVTKLLKENNSVVGATAIDLNFGGFIVFRAKSLVLATGGAGQVYPYTSQPRGCIGDGYSMALHVGGELIDMEFVQFFPIGLAYPAELKGILCGTPYYVHLLNAKKERFMAKYDARMELATRDIISRAMFKEIHEGRGTPHGGLYCDATINPPEFFRDQWPSLYDRAKRLGVDLKKDMMEVIPTVHYFMGGIKVNEKWETTTPGLFAAGEVTGGIHGANRIGQNSLADALVSGSRAGKYAGDYAARVEEIALPEDELTKEYERVYGLLTADKNGLRPFEIKEKIHNIMWNKVGIIRNEKNLRQALKELKELRANYIPKMTVTSNSVRSNNEWIEAIGIFFMLDSAELITKSALFRKETRGAHYREDYPETNDVEFLAHTSGRIRDEEIKIEKCPVDLSRISPR